MNYYNCSDPLTTSCYNSQNFYSHHSLTPWAFCRCPWLSPFALAFLCNPFKVPHMDYRPCCFKLQMIFLKVCWFWCSHRQSNNELKKILPYKSSTSSWVVPLGHRTRLQYHWTVRLEIVPAIRAAFFHKINFQCTHTQTTTSAWNLLSQNLSSTFRQFTSSSMVCSIAVSLSKQWMKQWHTFNLLNCTPCSATKFFKTQRNKVRGYIVQDYI